MQDQNTPMEQDAMMDEADLYTLVDEEGNEKLFELIDILEENGQVYFALIPHIEDPNELLEGEVELVVLIVGVVTAFVTSIIAIKFLMSYIKTNDFAIFGWYRIVLGIAVIAYFALVA